MTTTNPTDPDALHETAFHEAGHAVVGFVLGLKFDEKAVTTISDGKLAGEVKFEECTPAEDLCVAFAGVIAHAIVMAKNLGMKEGIALPEYHTWADVRGAARALIRMTKRKSERVEIWQALCESFLPPCDRSELYWDFEGQFIAALEQNALPEPRRIAGNDPMVFLELHRAAHRASTILVNNMHLVRALGSRLIDAREMNRSQLVTFLEEKQKEYAGR